MPNLELLDVIYYSDPNIFQINVERTAKKLRTAGGSRKSYDMAISPIPNIVSGIQKLEDLKAYWKSHKDEAWHPHLEDVGTRIFEIFSKEVCKWYPTGRRPVDSVGGLRIKPAIRGIKVANHVAFPCLINPRSSVILDPAMARPFVARGIYELHVRDATGLFRPMIIDLGKQKGIRANRIYYPSDADMISVEKFEEIMRSFNLALVEAGFTSNKPASAIDLFRSTMFWDISPFLWERRASASARRE